MSSSNVENAATMEAKMTVATSRDHCQQLKDMLSKEDPSSMVLVVASGSQSSTPKPRSAPVVMDPGLLAVACTGSWKELQSFLNGDPRPSSGDGDPWSMEWTFRCCCCVWKKRQSSPPRPTSGDGSSAIHQPSRDQEALPRVSFLDGVTIEGDTFLHVMATNSAGEDLVEDGLGLIRSKAVQFLSRPNKNGDTPLHCAARAAKPRMVTFLVELARGGKHDAVKELLKKQNESGWTALHEAVRAGNNDIVNLLMTENPELASFPKDDTSPMYLAILMENETIARTLHEKSGGVLSYSGPKGKNALHAAVLRSKDLTKLLLGWRKDLAVQQDENGCTPLHLAASMSLDSDLRTLQLLVVETIPDTSKPIRRDRRTIQLLLLEANTDALYQPDHDGLFPIHVAASVDATVAIDDFLSKSPSCAGLRDARGRTFLHVAADKMKIWTVRSACRNQSLSWILNMQDNDGNTALHLAVQKGSLRMFCALLENWKVQMNLTNKKGKTPRDIARCSLPEGGLYYTQNSEAKIQAALDIVGAKRGTCRQDCFEEDDTVQARENEIRRIKMLKDGTNDLCIGAVLIATVTFGATFAVPGGYRADDHTNGGTPTLAGGYVFDAFILANALAFASSAMATISLICSGSPMHNVRTRVIYLKVAFSLMTFSVTSLVAAFAFGTYIMLAPVAPKVAVAVCVLSSLVLLYPNVEVVIKSTIMRAAQHRRRRIPNKIVFLLSTFNIVVVFLFNLWPTMVILGLTALNYTRRKVEPAAQPPAPYH